MMIWILLTALLFPLNEEKQFSSIFDEATLSNGLVLDRTSDRTTVSCAATGLTAYSRALMVKRGMLDQDTTKRLLEKGFANTLASNPSSNGGWLYHFTTETGEGKDYSEISTIDSVLFYLGYLKAAELLGDEDFILEVQTAIKNINIDLMMDNGYFRHGFKYREGERIYLNSKWMHYDEGVLIYRLFNIDFNPSFRSSKLPLFVYYYPLCFYDDIEYVSELKKAVQYQKETFGYIGITACDGPEGYQIGDPAVVSPLSIYASSRYSELAGEELLKLSHDRMIPSFSTLSNWVANDKVLIDFASCYLCTRR